MDFRNVKKSWKKLIKQYEKEDFYKIIISKIKEWKKNKTKIYPNLCDIWETFKYFDVEETKVVLLGQDPYIREEIHNNKEVPQAVGLSFSVPKTHKIPPSLRNMFKELKNDLGIENTHGDISEWVKSEKILLLNSALTVVEGHSGSHLKYWEKFTDNLIHHLSENYENIIFLLLGNFAIKKTKLINSDKHQIIKATHPSPLSAHRGFFNSDVFKNVDNTLLKVNKKKISWYIKKK